MKFHEQDEIARLPLPQPRGHHQGWLLLHWVKPKPILEGPVGTSVVFRTVHLVRRYLLSGECIWYEPADNHR